MTVKNKLRLLLTAMCIILLIGCAAENIKSDTGNNENSNVSPGANNEAYDIKKPADTASTGTAFYNNGNATGGDGIASENLKLLEGQFIGWIGDSGFQVISNNQTYVFADPKGLAAEGKNIERKNIKVTYYTDDSGVNIAVDLEVKQ